MTTNGVSLKDYFDREIASIREAILSNRELSEVRFKSLQIAVDKAEEAQKLRNEAQNEWRAQFKDQTNNFPTRIEIGSMRNEFSSINEINTENIKKLELAQANQAGKASQQSVNTAFIISTLGLIIGIISIIFKFIK